MIVDILLNSSDLRLNREHFTTHQLHARLIEDSLPDNKRLDRAILDIWSSYSSVFV